MSSVSADRLRESADRLRESADRLRESADRLRESADRLRESAHKKARLGFLFRGAFKGQPKMATDGLNLSKMDWTAKRTVMEILMDYGATLFGGAVRDWYLHDTHASVFYEEMHKKKLSQVEMDKAYADPEVLPNLSGRRTTPRDIDATIPEAEVAPMLKALERRGFRTRLRFVRNPRNYIQTLKTEDGDLEHQCYTLEYIQMDFKAMLRRCFPNWVSNDPAMEKFIKASTRQLKELFGVQPWQYAFNIDLMVQKEGRNLSHLDAPFGCVDFECNALLMDKQGMRLSRMLKLSSGGGYAALWNRPADYDRLYRQVLRHITDQHAVVVLPPNDFPLLIPPAARIQKMLKKGWILDGFRTVMVQYEPNYEGHCLICHEEVKARHYKMKCCDARFHYRCLMKAMSVGDVNLIKTTTCFMCKSSCHSQDYHTDNDLLENIGEFLENQKKPQANAEFLEERGWLIRRELPLAARAIQELLAPAAPQEVLAPAHQERLPLAPPPPYNPLGLPLPPLALAVEVVPSEYSVDDDEF